MDIGRNGFNSQFCILNSKFLLPAAVLEAVKSIDYIFHLDAMVRISESDVKVKKMHENKINTQGTLTISEKAVRAALQGCFSKKISFVLC